MYFNLIYVDKDEYYSVYTCAIGHMEEFRTFEQIINRDHYHVFQEEWAQHAIGSI